MCHRKFSRIEGAGAPARCAAQAPGAGRVGVHRCPPAGPLCHPRELAPLLTWGWAFVVVGGPCLSVFMNQ